MDRSCRGSPPTGRRLRDGQEIPGDQGSAAHQPSIDIGLREQFRGVVGLDAAPVQEGQRIGDSSIARGHFATDEGMHGLRLGRGGGQPGADGPDRLVGDDRALERLRARQVEHGFQLLEDAELGLPVPALLLGLTHAEHRDQACVLGRDELAGHEFAALVVVLPALAMAHQAIACTHVDQHRRRDFAGIGALLVAADVLRAEGHAVSERVPLGAMIEVPAAAFALESFIDLVDFLSIGTNDLVQYLLAADRNNEALAELYTPLHPAVIRLVRDVIRLAHARGKSVAVCGEMAGDPAFTPLLLALGLSEFSLHPGTLLEVRRRIRECDLATLKKRVPALMRARDRSDIEDWVARACAQ